MSAADPQERTRNARVAALTRVSREGGSKVADHLNKGGGRFARFERLVDPDGVLDPQERYTRAKAAERSEMVRLAQRSAAKRRSNTA